LKTSPVSLSVLIPNYNHAAYLRECLDSVVGQSCQPDAIYVIDDASTDGSVEVIRSYVQRFSHVRLVQRPRNLGVHASVNEFLPQMEGSHVFFLAADDYLEPGALEMGREMLTAHPEAGFCLTDFWDVYPDGARRLFRYGISPAPAYFSSAEAARALRGRPLVSQCFVHLGGLRRLGGFPAPLRWHADHFICAVLALRQGFCYVPKAGGAFRKLPSSYSSQSQGRDAQTEVLLNFLEYFCRPEFRDVKSGLRDSHTLAIFERGLLSALCQKPEYRCFLTPSLAARLLTRQIRGLIRHPIPVPVKNWIRARLRRTALI
jgi:hypothetical protein